MMLTVIVLAMVWVAELMWPWWGLAPAALVAGAVGGKSTGRSAAAGFSGVALLWLFSSLYSHWSSGGILTAAMAELLQLRGAAVLLALTAVFGGVLGALATSSGFLLRDCLNRRKQP